MSYEDSPEPLTPDDLAVLRDDLFDDVEDTMTSKMSDYARKGQALENFKRSAEEAGISPGQAWLVYAGKHWSALTKYARVGALDSEGLRGRVVDMIGYCVLLYGMARERGED